MSEPPRSRITLLDSCAIVNLNASAHFESLLAILDTRTFVVDYVVRESQFMRTIAADGQEEKEVIDLHPAMLQGRLRTCSLESEAEFARFLELGLRLDDGEAATLALAAERNGMMISDDRKTLAIATELSVPTLTTLDIVHSWAEITLQSRHTIAEVLTQIRIRARYRPGSTHPLYSWWDAMIDSGELP